METNLSFAAIDFETATGYPSSACAVGIVIVDHGLITSQWHAFIQPPDNLYWHGNIRVHGIRPYDTLYEPDFFEIYPEIRNRLSGRTIVAHNEAFDRNVLKQSMLFYGLPYEDLNIADKWECTLRIYRRKGFRPAGLKACCYQMGIELNHHHALSDALACAQLYLRSMELA
jgi:DNA polymerase III subunit epsilon